MLTEDSGYHILRKLEAQPDISQRQLAQELGISLGKVNYCLKALIEKGLIKARNFSNSDNKKGYLYVLTPAGVESRAVLTARFLKRKIAEYEALRLEIEAIERELSQCSDPSTVHAQGGAAK